MVRDKELQLEDKLQRQRARELQLDKERQRAIDKELQLEDGEASHTQGGAGEGGT